MAASAPPSDRLSTDVQFLKGVGPKNAAALAKAGIRTVGDVLFYLPRRYDDRRNMPSVSSLRPGQWATLRGRLLKVESRPLKGGKVILKAWIGDKTGSLALSWFNQPWLRRKFQEYEGDVLAYGMVKEASWGYEINNPEIELIEADDEADKFARIAPVYPLTDGLPQRVIRKAAHSAIEYFLDAVADPLPPYLLKQYHLRPIRWSLRQLHMPESDELRQEARKRLVFEEFLYLQLALAMRRSETQQESGISFPVTGLHQGQDPIWQQIAQMLPFDLTSAQRRVIEEIWADMERPHPMNRLLQGDVGSGKTAVAACAMLAAVRTGYQAAIMAPTEILAEQHWINLHRLFDPLGIEVVLLVGKQTAATKKKLIERTATGKAQIAIGTHALIQEGVAFSKLGLVIVDEQHRFGVLQRAALREKGIGNPDVLVMTATPIPRTLTMTVHGDLDLSVIDELPPGRRPIKTHFKLPSERSVVYTGVKKLLGEGRQAYFVCPLVSESEKMLAQAAQDLHYRLTHEVYPDLRVGLLHGQLKPKEKEEVMQSFRDGLLDILVSTTVIEVGVDVPNASVMVVEDANRFGLSQLHQLRGRVGRGDFQSYCILIADARGEEARARMDAMVSTTDGFKIAEEDLRLRGPGELLGTRQSGNLDLKIADLVQDGQMLEVARQAAFEIVGTDPKLERQEHQAMLERVRSRRTDMAAVAIS